MSNNKENKSVETITSDLPEASVSHEINEEEKKVNEILKNRLRKYIKKLDGKFIGIQYVITTFNSR